MSSPLASPPSMDAIAPVTIDCHYLDQPGVAAAYLLRDGQSAAFVDNNTTHAVPRLLAALGATGLGPEQVEYLIVTHVHLDHAGGTSALARACPRATVLCHPRAERHLVDPAKLVASSRAVYGEQQFDRLYGRIDPIDPARVRAVADDEVVRFGARWLRFLHTRGHANHHLCVLDEGEGSIFTGDSFGIAYPRLQGQGLFVFPTTTPTDFDAAEAERSIARILGSGARRAFPTHFGEVAAMGEAAAQLLPYLAGCEQVVADGAASGLEGAALEARCARGHDALLDAALERRGIARTAEVDAFLRFDRELNAQGLAVAAARRRKPAPAA